jgi:PKD repeat protein
MPGLITAVLYEDVDGEWIGCGAVRIPAGSYDTETLTTGGRYKAVPAMMVDGYITPDTIVFTACDADIILVYERICPDPTVSITSVSNYNPASGETVDFESYSSGGTGHTIVSREWDFGDGTSSILANPSKAWTNTTGSSIAYTVTFTATNDCGKSKSTSTTITVSSEIMKTGIEIQFPASLDGKQLIAHGAISTVLDLWWTGPAVHGVLWTKGRATWDNIDSTKKYHISVGDACKETPPIDDVYPEYPDLCAGTFADGDDVVILVRNPGFDFRVYGSGNVHTLSGTSFGVLYLDETGGDIIDEVFTGKVCGWLGIPSGTECDAFWAEFYDPIFVANYMSIMSTGVDMFGNAKSLTWIDHVAFIAAIIGSLPVLNIIPIGAVVTRIGSAVKVIMRATLSLGVDDALKAGKALADICQNAPEVIGRMAADELLELRAALVKVYGDVVGNGYVDDALRLASGFVEKNAQILKEYTWGLNLVLEPHQIDEIITQGTTLPADVISMLDEVEAYETGMVLDRMVPLLKTGGPSGLHTISMPLGNLFDTVYTAKKLPHVTTAALNNMTEELCKVQKKALAEADPNAASNIAQGAFDISRNKGKIIDDACGVRP